jgi:hypothetical protein
MSKFGWSMPAGAWESTLPGEELIFCEVCLKDEYECKCPECSECSEIGRLLCYEEHGMRGTDMNIRSVFDFKVGDRVFYGRTVGTVEKIHASGLRIVWNDGRVSHSYSERLHREQSLQLISRISERRNDGR